MKKILLAAYSLDVGGIETALITLLKHLAPKYDITLVLEKKEGIFLESVPDGVNIITFEPCKLKFAPIRKLINFYKQQKFKLKYGNKFDFSACYTTYSLPSSFVARCASQNSALWVHNNYMDFYDQDIKKYKDFFNSLKADQFKKIVFVSKFDMNMFNVYFHNFKHKTMFCNNLIDYESIIQKSNEKNNQNKGNNSYTFINIGRHDEKQKKLTRIINATKKLNKEGYKFNVAFIGDGLDTQKYKELSKKVKNIFFLGRKKNPYPYLKNSDCLLMSSSFEGYPVVFVEAMILGKPIVTTDVSDAKNDIDGKYGIVVENSENGVYEGMKNFLENGFTPEKFSAEEFNKEIMEKLDKIIVDS